MSIETVAAQWKHARTLDDLGELTARWLEGSVLGHPSNGWSPPDSETQPLGPDLAAINRAGLVTEFSQPGEGPDSDFAQRAAVSGFCTPELALKLEVALLRTELITMPSGPGVTCHCPQVCITYWEGNRHDWQEEEWDIRYTWTGSPARSVDISDSFEGLHVQAIAALKDAWQITIIDPRWGRNDLLWPVLKEALEESATNSASKPQP